MRRETKISVSVYIAVVAFIVLFFHKISFFEIQHWPKSTTSTTLATQDTTRSAQSYINELHSIVKEKEDVMFALGVVCAQNLLAMQPKLAHAPADTLIKRAKEYLIERQDKRK